MTNQTFTFRVVAAHKTSVNDAGFASRVPVYVVVNQRDDVYASFHGNTGGHLSALAYRDRLAPTTPPPSMGGQLGSGYTAATSVGPSGEHMAYTTGDPALDDVMDGWGMAREKGEKLTDWQRRYPAYAQNLAEFEAFLAIDERLPDPEVSPEEEAELIERAIQTAQSVLEGRYEQTTN